MKKSLSTPNLRDSYLQKPRMVLTYSLPLSIPNISDFTLDMQTSIITHTSIATAVQCGLNHKILSAPNLTDMVKNVAICVATPSTPEEERRSYSILDENRVNNIDRINRFERLWIARRRNRNKSVK